MNISLRINEIKANYKLGVLGVYTHQKPENGR